MKPYLLAALLVAPCCQAFQAGCPDSAEQALEGWTRWQGEQPPADDLTPVVAASRIELYSGHPDAGGTPIADDFAEAIGLAPLQWSLQTSSHGEGLHMVCSYHASAQRQVRALPTGLSFCSADNQFEDAHLQLDCR